MHGKRLHKPFKRGAQACNNNSRIDNSGTHRGAKVVSDLMSEGDVGHLGGHVGAIVLHSDDTSVQRLSLPIRVELALLTNAPGTSCGGSRKSKRTPALSDRPHHVVQQKRWLALYDQRYLVNS